MYPDDPRIQGIQIEFFNSAARVSFPLENKALDKAVGFSIICKSVSTGVGSLTSAPFPAETEVMKDSIYHVRRTSTSRRFSFGYLAFLKRERRSIRKQQAAKAQASRQEVAVKAEKGGVCQRLVDLTFTGVRSGSPAPGISALETGNDGVRGRAQVIELPQGAQWRNHERPLDKQSRSTLTLHIKL